MKKLLLVLLMAVSFTAAAQDFVGTKLEFLDGKELKVRPADAFKKENGYKNFYSDEKLSKVYKKQGVYTKADAVEGKVFKLVSYTPAGTGQYALKLQNEDTGTLYYKYNSASPYGYPFDVIGGENLPDEAFCDQIVSDKDWNSALVKYVISNKTANLDDIQVRATDKDHYAMSLLITDSSNTKETINDITIFLENGEKITPKAADIEVQPGTKAGEYNFKATALPTKAEIDKLAESKIVKIQMGSHERVIEEGALLRRHIRCLRSHYNY